MLIGEMILCIMAIIMMIFLHGFVIVTFYIAIKDRDLDIIIMFIFLFMITLAFWSIQLGI